MLPNIKVLSAFSGGFLSFEAEHMLFLGLFFLLCLGTEGRAVSTGLYMYMA